MLWGIIKRDTLENWKENVNCLKPIPDSERQTPFPTHLKTGLLKLGLILHAKGSTGHYKLTAQP